MTEALIDGSEYFKVREREEVADDEDAASDEMTDELLLWNACDKGFFHKVKSIMEANPNVDLKVIDMTHRTGFSKACEHGYVEIVKHLLEHPNVPLNDVDWDNWGPFHYACKGDHVEVVKILLKHPGIVAISTDEENYTTFDWALYYGAIKSVKVLIASGIELKWNLHKKDLDKSYEKIRGRGFNELADLLERFVNYPNQTRDEIKAELDQLKKGEEKKEEGLVMKGQNPEYDHGPCCSA